MYIWPNSPFMESHIIRPTPHQPIWKLLADNPFCVSAGFSFFCDIDISGQASCFAERPSLWICLVVSLDVIRCRSTFGQGCHVEEFLAFSVPHTRKHNDICPIIEGVKCDHLVKVVPADFSIVKVIFLKLSNLYVGTLNVCFLTWWF